MKEQPEALRLADALRDGTYLLSVERAATEAELRRLHADVERLTRERDVLLEALRMFVSCALPVSTEIDERGHRWTEAYLDQALPIARAAIKAVEEGK
jgi:hypothetical protein